MFKILIFLVSCLIGTHAASSFIGRHATSNNDLLWEWTRQTKVVLVGPDPPFLHATVTHVFFKDDYIGLSAVYLDDDDGDDLHHTELKLMPPIKAHDDRLASMVVTYDGSHLTIYEGGMKAILEHRKFWTPKARKAFWSWIEQKPVLVSNPPRRADSKDWEISSIKFSYFMDQMMCQKRGEKGYNYVFSLAERPPQSIQYELTSVSIPITFGKGIIRLTESEDRVHTLKLLLPWYHPKRWLRRFHPKKWFRRNEGQALSNCNEAGCFGGVKALKRIFKRTSK